MLAARDGSGPPRGPNLDRYEQEKTNGSVPDQSAIGPPPQRLWFLALSTAFLGGALGWTVGNKAEQWVHWTVKVRPLNRVETPQPDATGFTFLLISREEAERRNTALAMGILGGVLGLTAGAAGGMVRNTNLAVARGGLGGLVLGTTAGVSVPWMLVPEFYRCLNRAPSAMLPVIVHAIVYAAIGGAAGLALGYGLLERRGAARGLLAGVMGALLGSVLFDVLHTVFFPMEWDFSPMPGKLLSRLLAHLCVAMFSVTCATLALREEMHRALSEGVPVLSASKGDPPRSAKR